MRFDFKYIIILLIFLFLLAQINKKPKTVKEVVYKEKSLTPDTVIQIDTITKIDTAYIIKEFYKKRVYLDTIVINNTDSVFVKDTIYQNKLLPRTITTIEFAQERRKRLFLGSFYHNRQIGLLGGYSFKKTLFMAGVSYKSLFVGAAYRF